MLNEHVTPDLYAGKLTPEMIQEGITAEMLAAGVSALIDWENASCPYPEVAAAAIYSAMKNAKHASEQ